MSEPIREFLVSLGFNIDEVSWKKFKNGVSGSTENVYDLGKAAVKTAYNMVKAVEIIAKQYEDLYYASQRTEASVQGLQAFGYASEQIGLSAEQGKGAVESFAAALRTSPGLHGALQQLGVSAKEPQEQIAQLVERLKELYGAQGAVGYATAANIAAMFNIPEGVFKHFWENMEKAKAKTADLAERMRAAGVDTEALTKASVDLGDEQKRLTSDLELVGQKVESRLVGPVKEAVSWFDKLIQRANVKGGVIDQALDLWTGVPEVVEAISPEEHAKRRAAAGQGGPAQSGNGSVPPQAPKDIRPIPRLHSSSERDRRDETIAYFERQGWTRAQAFGIAANLQKESPGFNPHLYGDNGAAYGVAQWHKDRQDAFKAWSGHDIRMSSLEEQLAFIQHELTQGGERGAGARLRAAKTARDAAAVVSRFYERPKATYPEMITRGTLAQNWFDAAPVGPSAPAEAASQTQNINQTNNITIHTASSPNDVADAVNAALELDKAKWRLLARQDGRR